MRRTLHPGAGAWARRLLEFIEEEYAEEPDPFESDLDWEMRRRIGQLNQEELQSLDRLLCKKHQSFERLMSFEELDRALHRRAELQRAVDWRAECWRNRQICIRERARYGAPELEDGESEHDDSGEESADGSDSADEIDSGETDDGEERARRLRRGERRRKRLRRRDGLRGNERQGSGVPLHADSAPSVLDPLCRGAVRLSTSRCIVCRRLNYGCPETGLCIDPAVYDWLSCSRSTPGFEEARGASWEDVFRLPFIAPA